MQCLDLCPCIAHFTSRFHFNSFECFLISQWNIMVLRKILLTKPMSVMLHHVRSFLWPIREITFIWFPVCTYAISSSYVVFLLHVFDFFQKKYFLLLLLFRVCDLFIVRYVFTKINHSFVSLDYDLSVYVIFFYFFLAWMRSFVLLRAICTNIPNLLYCPRVSIIQMATWNSCTFVVHNIKMKHSAQMLKKHLTSRWMIKGVCVLEREKGTESK